MTYNVLGEAREKFFNEVRGLYGIPEFENSAALYTPETWKIWESIRNIVAQTYKPEDKYSAKLEYIPDDQIKDANELADTLCNAVLEHLKNKGR